MQINIISDFVCPYCYIASKNLELALESVPYRDEIEIKYQSFQLYPDLPNDNPISLFDMLKKFKNLSYEHIELLLSHVNEVAEELDLSFDFHNLKYTNTVKTHRVFKYANSQGLGNEFFNKMYESFFTDAKIITETDVLLEATSSLGLNEIDVLNVIYDEDMYRDDVLQDVADSYAIEVWSVPFLAFDEKYGIYGGKSAESIITVMDKIYDGSIKNEEPSYKNNIKFLSLENQNNTIK